MVFLHLVFESIARYQFLYKDVVNVLARHERLRSRFQKIITKKQKATLQALNNLQQQGRLNASPS